MKINQLSAATSHPAPQEWVTGQAWLEELGLLPTPVPTLVVRMTFAPGARTVWHSHALGQVLHILDGVARIGREGDPVRELHPGDTVAFGPAERHWHGAVPGRMMSHLAVHAAEPEGGAESVVLERVSDSAYEATV